VRLSLLVIALALIGCSNDSDRSSRSVVSRIECDADDLQMVGLDSPVLGDLDGTTGYFSMCDFQHEEVYAQSNRVAARPIEVFADAHRTHAVAWLYPDCGSPNGLVLPGKSPPCESVQLTEQTLAQS
jgi:hypothetical protein